MMNISDISSLPIGLSDVLGSPIGRSAILYNLAAPKLKPKTY